MIRLPLYRQAADLIRKKYVLGKTPGLRLPSETDLEKELEVSVITIRAALKELENQRFVERRPGSGTYVCERNTDDRHVALLLEADVSSPALSPYYLKLLQEVRHLLLKMNIPSRPYLGYLRLGVEIGELTCREFIEDLKKERISGVIALLAQRHSSWVAQLHRRSIPLIGTRLSGDIVVDLDYNKVAHHVLSYFGNRNCQKMALIGRDDKFKDSPNIIEVFKQVAPEYGISIAADGIRSEVSGLDADEGVQAVHSVWSEELDRPDCIFIESDLIFNQCHAAIFQKKGGSEVALATWGSDAVSLPLLPNMLYCMTSISTEAQVYAEIIQKYLHHQEVPGFNEIPFVERYFNESVAHSIQKQP